MIKNLNISLKLRNNQLVERREKLGLSAPKFAAKIGISYGCYLAFENMATKPFHQTTGEIKESAAKILDFLVEDAETIWPDEVLKIEKTRAIRAVDIEDIPMLGQYSKMATLPTEQIAGERLLMGKVRGAMSELTPRQRKVLTMRFSSEDYSRQDIARELEITSGRVQQIEVRALRKLKWFLNRDEKVADLRRQGLPPLEIEDA